MMLQFAMMAQIMIVIITVQLPGWLGDDLSKAGMTYAIISVLPILVNSYQVFIAGSVPLIAAFYIENTM